MSTTTYDITTIPKTTFGHGDFPVVRPNNSNTVKKLEMFFAFLADEDGNEKFHVVIRYPYEENVGRLSYFIINDDDFDLDNSSEAHDCIFPPSDDDYKELVSNLEQVFFQNNLPTGETIQAHSKTLFILSEDQIEKLSKCIFHTEHAWRIKNRK